MSARQIRRDMDRLRGTVRARSSVTGKFVSLWYAITHPKTTVVEIIRGRRG
jgi:hypothetical protein